MRTAHAAQASSEEPAACEVAAEMLTPRFDEGLIGTLHNALAADVDPRTGGHLAEHHQTFAVQLVKVIPGRPFGHQVGVRDQHARRVEVGAEHSHRLTRLDQQRFVFLQLTQRLQDGFETVPVPCRLTDAAVDHERVRVLGNIRVKVVLDHPVRGFDQPIRARDL